MYADQTPYISYLLRLWQEKSEGKLTWRASLESPLSGERWGFSDTVGLLSFLEREMGKYPTEVLPDKNTK